MARPGDVKATVSPARWRSPGREQRRRHRDARRRRRHCAGAVPGSARKRGGSDLGRPSRTWQHGRRHRHDGDLGAVESGELSPALCDASLVFVARLAGRRHRGDDRGRRCPDLSLRRAADAVPGVVLVARDPASEGGPNRGACVFGFHLMDHAHVPPMRRSMGTRTGSPMLARWTHVLTWVSNLTRRAVASTNPGLVFLRTGRKGVAMAYTEQELGDLDRRRGPVPRGSRGHLNLQPWRETAEFCSRPNGTGGSSKCNCAQVTRTGTFG